MKLSSRTGSLHRSRFFSFFAFWIQNFANASTYHLNYDGIISPNVLDLGLQNHSIGAITEVASNISSNTANAIYKLWCEMENSEDLVFEATNAKVNCISHEIQGDVPDAISCNLHYFGKKMSMQLSMKVAVGTDSENEVLHYSDGEDSLLFGSSLDVTFTASEDKGRDILVAIIPKVNDAIQFSDPVWSIQARPSPSELLRMREKHFEKEALTLAATKTPYIDSISSYSLESMILSNQFLSRKELVAKTDHAEIWQYSKLGSTHETTTSLFIDSEMRYTTELSGSAHAEAFIHPTLISHPQPSSIAILSDAPLAFIKEALKHRKVEVVVVFTSKEILDIATTFFPDLNDCNDIEGEMTKCLDSERVIVIDLNDTSEDSPEYSEIQDLYYNIVFIQDTELSYDNMYQVFDMIEYNSDSVVVINEGSTPDVDAVIHEEIESEDHRAHFLRRVTRSEKNGGHEEASVHVYDEPNAAPLDSTFIMVTAGDFVNSKTYRRFMRKNPAPIDLDIAKNMYPSSSSYINTVHYDGPTHVSYTRPSRAWEYWFCNKKPWKDMVSCSTFLPKFMDANYHVDRLEVVQDSVKGRTTKAMEDIPAGHILSPQDSSVSLFFDDQHYEALHNFVKEVPSAILYKQMVDVIDGYGFQVSTHGFGGFVCSIANNTFMNHACTKEQLNAGPMESLVYDEDGVYTSYFDPLATRRSETFGVHTFSLRDLKKGEEILMDYRHLRDNDEVRDSEKGMCEGKGIIPIDQEKDPAVGQHQKEEL